LFALAVGLVQLPTKNRKKQWLGWLQSNLSEDGWAMPRHSIMPDADGDAAPFADDPWTQIRPDRPIVKGWKEHHHGHKRDKMHEAKTCDLDDDGNPLPTGHLHPETGEIVVPLEGLHRHLDQAKYLYTPGGTAKRLGTNPLNLERGYEGDLFVIVMEGTLKMCAVTEAGYPCIDAGSVNLWGGDTKVRDGYLLELEAFADRYLRGRRVAVVCDSDWYANWMVEEQTKQVAAVLEPIVGRVVACAPGEGKSYGWRHPLTGVEMKKKRGIDDALGEFAPADRHEAFLDEVGFYGVIREAELTTNHPLLTGMRSDGRKGVVDTLKEVGKYAPPGSATTRYPETRAADALRRPKKSVQRNMTSAKDVGLAREVAPAERRPRIGGGFYMEPPLLELVPEALPKHEWRTLRQWLNDFQ
jgi:hypothetical protein